jgi:8-oxo-dGTP diphosphatase
MLMGENYHVANRQLLITAVALVDRSGHILVQKRPAGKPMAGLWEFPGGKVEADETPSSALCRELAEELNIRVDEKDLQPFAFASEPLGERQLLLLLYICRLWQGDPHPVIADELRWCTVDALTHLAMPPADVPLVDRLREIL